MYSNNIKALAHFYTELFSMTVTRETSELISLVKDGFNIIIHIPPVTIPQSDFNTIKLFMAVDDLETAKLKAVELGGRFFDGVWSNPLFTVCNIADSDGNHIQLREFA
ncbi:VOC family protein [Arsukibacterium tuosuense]|uniref:VOC family protein n=1 Tax=Arsukibacterium tuosuense TaxID=1323745 RepID=UPI001143DD7F|nr:VOC family protein [Arsukibacterium tuosuense]